MSIPGIAAALADCGTLARSAGPAGQGRSPDCAAALVDATASSRGTSARMHTSWTGDTTMS